MDLQLVDQLHESRQYSNSRAMSRTTSRDILDHAFIDIISLWVLYNVYEMSSVAVRYAQKTMQFNNFRVARHTSTDLSLTLHVALTKNLELTTATKNDAILLDRVRMNEIEVKNFLNSIAQNNASENSATRFLQKLERGFVIADSSYKSVRRLAQDWPHLTDMQRSLVMTRILQFYRSVAPRSELFYFMRDLAKTEKLRIRNARNAEQPKVRTSTSIAAAAGLGVVGYAAGKAGYNLGRRMV